MNILVAFASKHGSTREIAQVVGSELESAGHHADVIDVNQIGNLEGYAGVVIGSAVYAGHWLGEAKSFVKANQIMLQTLPVWLFSSGPLGDQSRPAVNTAEVDWLMQSTNARQHTIFGGRVDSRELNVLERAVTRIVGASGDHRDWDEIRSWSQQISVELATAATPANPAVL
jgi:menaquinone-dependent protoporphyrinogen oxidase